MNAVCVWWYPNDDPDAQLYGVQHMIVGAWSDFETLVTIPSDATLVRTTDTLAPGSATGTASALYKLDTEQADFTAQMTSYINGAVATGQTLAAAQTAMNSVQKLWRRKNANIGKWFTLAEPEPWTGQFGCPGDGAQSVSIDASGNFIKSTTGTDVFSQLQGFIDYCVYFAKCQGRIGKGAHRVSQGLQHGYGDRVVGGVFRGAGQSYSGNPTFVGSTIICDTDEDPILNIAGDRDVVWQGVSFSGQYATWLVATTICFPSSDPTTANSHYSGYDSLDPQAWITPYMRTSQDGRYNPAALVTLGAFDGAKPMAATWATNTAYGLRACVQANGNVYTCIQAGTSATSGAGPSGTGIAIADGSAQWRYLGVVDPSDSSKFVAYREPYRPGWLLNPNNSAYGNVNYGSFCTFRDCFFTGSPTLVACKPGQNALQDDFLCFERCNFTYFNFGFSAGNHQLRNLLMQGCNLGIGNCALTNMVHGNQTGSFKDCHINDSSFGASVDVFRVNATYGQPMVFTACYCEGQFRLGQILGGGRSNMGPLFQGCEWNLTGVHPARGRAPRQLYVYPDGTPGLVNEAITSGVAVPTTFANCKINVNSVFTAFVAGVTLRDTIVSSLDRVGVTVSPYLAYFSNACADGLIVTGLDYRTTDQRVIFGPHDLDTGAPSPLQVRTEPGYKYGDRTLCIPAMVRTVRAGSGNAYEELAVPQEAPFTLSKTSPGVTVTFPTPVLSTDPLTMQIVWTAANKATTADLQGFGAGSICVDGPTGTVFAVKSFDSSTHTLIAEAQDNYRTGGAKVFIRPPSTTSGVFVFLHARNYTPVIPLFGDFSTSISSTTIANVGTSAGVGTTIESSVAVGDYLASPQELWAYAPATASVTARANGSPGSITLSVNATKTITGTRLGFFRRPSL